MDKRKLTRFIDKYHLGGIANSVILKSSFKNKKLGTKFVTEDKTLLGIIQLDKWDFEDAIIGIYTTEQLLNLLKVLDEDITVSIIRTGDRPVSLKISDSVSSVNYMLSDPDIINEPPQLQHIPEYELSIYMTPTVIGKFIAGNTALKEVSQKFTVVTNGTSTKLVMGYSSANTNRVIIPVTTSKFAPIDMVSFNAEYFNNILIANKECESGILQVSNAGIAKIDFKVDDYTCTYWLVADSDIS